LSDQTLYLIKFIQLELIFETFVLKVIVRVITI